ncbi:hypothetical protein POTOM_031845 [Populus tomentosa]|uniref:Uncharacterized protein n=1 Tax=Populus tomentosa TaxID=118781 RepID=A0A8X8CS95_POPTO|nr:hypothetical protein POTOM_031845 [Populus tomentosa]
MGSSSFSNCIHNNRNMEKALENLGHQENYFQEPCACNEMIDILTSTKYKKQQFRIVCGMFDYLKRNNKNLVPAECSLVKDADALFKTVKNKVKPDANTYN